MSKVCVVAGVGPGNGASCCRRFAAEGYSIVMLARNADYLASLSAQLPGSLPIACDVRDPEAIETAFDRIRGEAGEVDVLIYNAGSGEWNSVEETTIEGMESSWRTNTLGLLVASQQVIPPMKARASGSIVVIGATASLRGGANSTAFASAKSAQRSLAQSMARRLGPTGIHVSYVIIDGIIDLERTRAARPDIPDEYYLQPDDIAQSVYDLTCQHRSAWTFELDLRPFGEKW
ncbi:MAG TPA: SDR family NAD(P)-dependent oxidoreductase [Gammaproteobacteria bacterium]|jgi:NAD(P)-dependent dehydrogenase (short-subunit alcohol dehydrogenase family)|nr:SDR family NAD(P)-dependent oxidoreductase [Gammaproteobacteria bacterium]RTZ65023.1 MAG: short-chain dehydrogenase [Gammaproteobacteria bacterium]HBK77510.1 short-chain dehydrogenase [Gammaproteobacteria bacterium]HHZ71910.1 SDR family NAD(P)-dependent oxidoreductase [Gammaproteobacteria bacterium]HIA41080.1 SDR family NAD(P)-dependent oxidoreductase [Gammaproteobacteria bacterium]